ncbi:MAG: VCBS repeat-containing protein [Deltaproteobacteria bacterium]|nr:VCBS repeat-containing protein [Deltaproteobacteria bacterium]
MKNILILIGVAAVITGCKATNRTSGDNGDIITTFNNTTGLQISAISGQATSRDLLIGKFTNDIYPDVVELTDQGAFFIKNNSGASWTVPANSTLAIAATSAQAFTHGIARDLDGDGILDLVLYKTGEMIMLINDGNGSFSETTNTTSTLGTMISMAFAPKAADAKTGFIMGAISGGNHFVQEVTSASAFGTYTTNAFLGGTIINPIKVVAADMNHDGYTDFVMVPSAQSETVQIFKNTTDTSIVMDTQFSRVPNTTVSDATTSVLTRTNYPDLILTTSAGVELYKNTTTAALDFEQSTVLKPSTLSAVADTFVFADFTMDGLKDFFFTRSSAKSLFYTQTSSLVFSDITTTAFGATTSLLTAGPVRAYEADIDGNGVTDLLELYATGQIVVHMNQAEPN